MQRKLSQAWDSRSRSSARVGVSELACGFEFEFELGSIFEFNSLFEFEFELEFALESDLDFECDFAFFGPQK